MNAFLLLVIFELGLKSLVKYLWSIILGRTDKVS